MTPMVQRSSLRVMVTVLNGPRRNLKTSMSILMSKRSLPVPVSLNLKERMTRPRSAATTWMTTIQMMETRGSRKKKKRPWVVFFQTGILDWTN